jgi:hypothetical protein
MTKIIILIFILSFSSIILPQELSKTELDSLYNLFTFVKGVNSSEKMQQHLLENPEIGKCGLGLVTSVKQNINSFTPEQQSLLNRLLERPTLSNSVVTSNGFFRVHYDLTGVNTLGYDLNLLLQAIDSTYSFEINFLGYPAPPSDGTEGGDDKYDIYIQNIPGFYGYTQPENKVNSTNWTSYLVIDNDFPAGSYYTQGINAAKVTVAHEFHHAIQMGNFAPSELSAPFRESDRFFYEITSTAFEEFVFDDVNDYYAYMSSYFQNPETPMSINDGYNLAIWNIYLQNNFDFDILKRQWELMPGNDALKAIALSIDESFSTFGNELNKFGVWTYFTNSRATSGRYFEEASNYPLITPTATVSFTPPSKTYDMTVGPVANYYLKINLPSSDGVFYSIITNSDYEKTSNQTLPFSFSIYQDTVNGEKVINDFYSVSFDKAGQPFWNNAGILNNIVVYGDSSYSIPEIEGESFAYPMPIKKSATNTLYIAFQSNGTIGEEVDLNIYSAGVEQYYTGKKIIQSAYLKNSNKYCEISLNKSDFDFPSGVYIYVIKSGDEIFKGKLVIFND